jgi:hypothetical protein
LGVDILFSGGSGIGSDVVVLPLKGLDEATIFEDRDAVRHEVGGEAVEGLAINGEGTVGKNMEEGFDEDVCAKL